MRDSTACHDDGSVRARRDRWFRAGVVLILALAAVNLFFRLDREVVTEWDEALYAISAAETARNGNWIGTTFNGALDYYNTKPPLNIWLIALAFKTFGINLVALRIASALAAWLTVLVLMLWARRAFGAPTALLAGLVLSATYGFIYVHSGRSANTDALFTLFVLLTVVTLWEARDHPWRLAYLNPFYPLFALLVGRIFAQGFECASASAPGGAWRGRVLIGVILLALAVAEGKLFHYSRTMRDVRHSVQGLLLAERNSLSGQQVYQDRWTGADRFVLEHVIGGHARQAKGIAGFVRAGRRGDYVIVPEPHGAGSEIVLVRANRRHRLCRRVD